MRKRRKTLYHHLADIPSFKQTEDRLLTECSSFGGSIKYSRQAKLGTTGTSCAERPLIMASPKARSGTSLRVTAPEPEESPVQAPSFGGLVSTGQDHGAN